MSESTDPTKRAELLAEELPMTDIDEEALDEIWGAPGTVEEDEEDEIEDRAARPVQADVVMLTDGVETRDSAASKKAWETRRKRKAEAAAQAAGGGSSNMNDPEWRMEQINKHGKALRGRKTEKVVAFDADGNVVFAKSGTTSRVSLNAYELDQMRGGVQIHNHPAPTGGTRGASFSGSDVVVAAVINSPEIAVVTKTHTFRMIRPETGWPSTLQIQADYATRWQDAQRRARVRLASGDSYDDVNFDVQDDMNRELAAKYGATYMVIPYRGE
jgi:hypothetical protein